MIFTDEWMPLYT